MRIHNKGRSLDFYSMGLTGGSTGGAVTTNPTACTTRPADWLTIDDLVDINNEQKVVLLLHLSDTVEDTNVAINIVTSTDNTININWGDGTIDENVASGKSVHSYNFDNLPSSTNLDGGTTKQVIVTISASSSITSFKYYVPTLNSALYNDTVVDAILSLPHVETLSSCFYSAKRLQYCKLSDLPECRKLDNTFRDCYMLEQVTLGATPKVTTTYAMFFYAKSLVELSVPNGVIDLPACRTTTYMFYSCPRIHTIVFGDLPEVIYVQQTCRLNVQLKTFKVGNMPKVTDMLAYLKECKNLTNLELGDFSNATNVTDMLHSTGPLLSFQLGTYNKSLTLERSKVVRRTILELFNNLPTTTDGELTFTNTPSFRLLTDTEKAVATDKGWTLIN